MARKLAYGATVMAGRLFYAMNWYNVSPALGDISSTYHVSFSLTGIIFAAFLVGAGIFQIPAGIIASKIGGKNTSVIGLIVMSAAAVGSAHSPTFLVFTVMRLLTGVGAAFFFSSAIGVLSEIYFEKLPQMMGLYNGFFSIGAGVGIFAMGPLISFMGWQNSLTVSGLITLVSAILMYVIVPPSHKGDKLDISKIKIRILDKRIWFIALGFAGLWSLNFTIGEYFRPFAVSYGYSGFIAGLMASMIMFLGIIGGMLTSAFRKSRPIRTSVYLTMIVSFSLFLLLLNSSLSLWTSVVINGVFSVIIFSLEYTAVIRLDDDRRYVPLNVGLINSIQIGIGSLIPLVFAFLIPFGYAVSWIFLAVFSLMTLPLVYLFRIR
ncbi:MAG: MFS transporter [Thermoplasmataceae archaeon]